MNYLITPRGEKQQATPRDGVAFTVTELQDMVDGYITIEDIGKELLVFDVEGAINDKLYNKTATQLLLKFNPEYEGFVAGNAVVCTRVRVD